MKIVRCRTDMGECYGLWEGEVIRLLAGEPFAGIAPSGEVVAADAVKLLAPCRPSKIVAVGINYAPHARELDFGIPPEPLLFLKPPSAVIGPEEEIMLPAMSAQVDYEGELAVVIGRPCKNVAEEEALRFVLGYTCCNDVTARDLQKKDVQFTRSKSFDTFAPLGPCIETKLDPGNVMVRSFVNGDKRQEASTATMIRSVPELVSFISRVMTLLPGDVIATGTPAGVGPLQSGDLVAVAIEPIGTLANPVRGLGR
ncbi:MAG: fumarylacetoacetate hydrolase family protein [Thermodesulfobacteriota bacterium]